MRVLDKFQLVPIKDEEGTALRLRLWFVGRAQPLEFETSGKNAMIFLSYLQEFQAEHEIPIPQLAFRRKRVWKPYVVK